MKRLCIYLLMMLFFCTGPAFTAVRVGIPIFNPPFVISKYEGFDVELINIVCKRLPDGCTFVSMEYSQLYNALNNGKVDIAIGGLTISTTGEGKYVYSNPYKISIGQFVILANSDIQTVDALKGDNIGCIINSTFADFMANNYAGVVTLQVFENMVQLINALVSGSIKAIFIDQVVTDYWSAQLTGQFKLLGKPIVTGSGYAIVGTATSLDLIKQINSILSDIKKNGDYVRLYNAYFTH